MTTANTPAAATAVELIYTAPTGKRTAGRVHRATCKHTAKTAERVNPAQAGVNALRAASLATCCSVREADRGNAVAIAREAELAATAVTAVAAAPGHGALRSLVAAHLNSAPGETFTPYRTAKALGRSCGAVAKALDKLVALDAASLTCDAPRTYQAAR